MRRTASWSLGLLLLVGCRDNGSNQATLGAEPPKPAPEKDATKAEKPPVPSPTAPTIVAAVGGRTTDGNAARNNLTSQIQGFASSLAAQPDLLDLRSSLVQGLLARTAFFGSYADFDTILLLTEDGLRLHPGLSKAILLRAKALSSLHRFTEASVLVGTLPTAESAQILTTIQLALGSGLAELVAARKAAAEANPSLTTYADLAAARAAAGQFDQADADFVHAVELYRDVAPFPLAYIAFQRGVMWAEVAGKPYNAVPLYREALRRVPDYVVARVHLAELLAGEGHTAEAITLLEPLVGTTDDPEPLGVLSELLHATDPTRAATLAKDAGTKYRALLTSHRAAFADHGAEFFASVGGDPAFALTLALENFAARPTERARLVAIESAIAAGDHTQACTLAKGAPKEPISVPLKEAIATACKTP